MTQSPRLKATISFSTVDAPAKGRLHLRLYQTKNQPPIQAGGDSAPPLHVIDYFLGIALWLLWVTVTGAAVAHRCRCVCYNVKWSRRRSITFRTANSAIIAQIFLQREYATFPHA